MTPCAQVSSAINEPMLGTAPQVGLWVLLEVRETWQPQNLEDNSLPDIAKAWLDEVSTRGTSAGLMPRIQFIRRRRRASEPLTLMTCLQGVLRKQEFGDFAHLMNVDVIDSDIPICNDILYLVCTHTKRDICCSREGLPTWQRLDMLSQGRAWQTTHLGGHRFAPNVLALPSGRSYSRVRANEIDGFFSAIEEGRVPTRFLRGNSALPPDAQACEPAILERGGTFLRIEDDQVQFETQSGIQSIPVPKKTEMQILAGCSEREWKTVQIYESVGWRASH